MFRCDITAVNLTSENLNYVLKKDTEIRTSDIINFYDL